MKSETRVTQVIDTLQQITNDATTANDVILHNMRKKLLDMLVLEYNKISLQPQNPLNSILALATHLDDPTAQNIGKTTYIPKLTLFYGKGYDLLYFSMKVKELIIITFHLYF